MQEGTSELGSKSEQMRLGHSMCKGPGAAGAGLGVDTARDSGETMTGPRPQAQGGLLTELASSLGTLSVSQWLRRCGQSLWGVGWHCPGGREAGVSQGGGNQQLLS